MSEKQKQYNNLQSYAKKISNNGEDILHEAWLNWLVKKNEDLLETKEGTWKKVLQYTAKNFRRVYETNRIGGKEQQSFAPIEKAIDRQTETFVDYSLIDRIVIPEHLKEAYEIITGFGAYSPNSKNIKEVKEVIKKEIQKTQIVHMFSNPFAGSKLVVKKSITEIQWEKREDKEEFECEDYNESYLLFKHKESGEGWLVKIKETEKYNPYIKRIVEKELKDLEDSNK